MHLLVAASLAIACCEDDAFKRLHHAFLVESLSRVR
jgi:hypothetical protein